MKRQTNRLSFVTLTIVVFTIMILQAGCTDDALGPENPSVTSETDEGDVLDGLSKGGRGPGSLTVMTRNVYVGTDVDAIISGEASLVEAFETLVATNFPERADAFAREIKRLHPHLIGLQEISEITVELPIPPYLYYLDYLDILMASLDEQGLHYRVVGKILDADVQMADPTMGVTASLRDFDVLLARQDVSTSNVVEANYLARLIVPDLGLEIPRGYVAADATVKGRTYRIVTTHLEPFIPGWPFPEQIQVTQMNELMAALAGETSPTIVMGDLNTQESDEAYEIIAEEYSDLWNVNRRPHKGPGYTCCEEADLLNDPSILSRRFDLIFYRSNESKHGNKGLGVVWADVVGEESGDRTSPSGLWPSDHAGVVATMIVPKAAHSRERWAHNNRWKKSRKAH